MSALQKEALPVMISYKERIMQQPATLRNAAGPGGRLHCGLANVGQHGKMSQNTKVSRAVIADPSPLAGDGGSSRTLLS